MADKTKKLFDLWVGASAQSANPLDEYCKHQTVILSWAGPVPVLYNYSLIGPEPFKPSEGGYNHVTRVAMEDVAALFENGTRINAGYEEKNALDARIRKDLTARGITGEKADDFIRHTRRLMNSFDRALANKRPTAPAATGAPGYTAEEQARIYIVLERLKAEREAEERAVREAAARAAQAAQPAEQTPPLASEAQAAPASTQAANREKLSPDELIDLVGKLDSGQFLQLARSYDAETLQDLMSGIDYLMQSPERARQLRQNNLFTLLRGARGKIYRVQMERKRSEGRPSHGHGAQRHPGGQVRRGRPHRRDRHND